VSIAMIPARLQVEPTNMVAYDRWQDAEGLLDASKACRAAWAGWRDTWRRERDAELAQDEHQGEDRQTWLASLDPFRRKGADQAVRLGSWMGTCSGRRGRELAKRERDAWWRWRSRVLRHDPDVWWALWSLADGVPLGLLAVRHGRGARGLAAGVDRALGWLLVELYGATIVRSCHRVGRVARTPPPPQGLPMC
jgi:hypothetical protein